MKATFTVNISTQSAYFKCNKTKQTAGLESSGCPGRGWLYKWGILGWLTAEGCRDSRRTDLTLNAAAEGSKAQLHVILSLG